MMTATEEVPRIYVACLACYNASRLTGEWHEVTDDPQDKDHAELTGCRRPDHEEYAIHDHEYFRGLKVGEYDSLDDVAELGKLLAEHGAAYAAYVGCVGEHYATPEGFTDSYQGEFTSAEAFAEELLEGTGQLRELPEWAQEFFDMEAYARSLEDGFTFVKASYDVVYVFADQ